MYQLAREAGVSQPTVSRILNNKESMYSSETIKRVRDTARKLNYRPNYFARTLKKGKTGCIGLMGSHGILDFSVKYMADIFAGVENQLDISKSEYSLVIFGANYHGSFQKSIELIRRGMVDGMLFVVLSVFKEKFENEIVPLVNEYNIPYVAIHSLNHRLTYNNVGFDSQKGGYLAGEHLINCGYTDIGYYDLEAGSPQHQLIFKGFREALAERGVPFSEQNVINPKQGIYSQNIYDNAFQTFTDVSHYPEALVVPSDAAAYGILDACKEKNIGVPEDMALIGFNNELPQPSGKSDLTTIEHPIKAKAGKALQMVLDLLTGKRDKNQVHTEIIKPELVIRKSSGFNNK